MSVNLALMEEVGYGRELAQLGAAGFQCVHDNGDGELPVAIFAKVETGILKIIQGMDFRPPDDDSSALMFSATDFEDFASGVMGLLMANREQIEGW